MPSQGAALLPEYIVAQPKNTYLLVLPPSLGSARLVQFFQKARVEKNGKNEPIWGLFKNSIWKSLILTKKDQFFSLK